ncbi:MAG: TniQ family protein [Hydrogenophaga sp.]|nr:TniQ family protein [Hydrogenophaga sp.]
MRKPLSHDMQAPRQLPVTLAPCTDELLSSWVARHAEFYGVPPLAMLRHCLPEMPSLRAADLNLNDNQILRLARVLCVDAATIRHTTFVEIAQSSRCLIANDAIQSCPTCCPAKMEPRAILRSQLLGWRITCTLCGSLLQCPTGRDCPSTFGHYHATALIGERLLQDEASRKARTWASPVRIARLLLMRRVKKPRVGSYEPWRYRVLGALIPDLDDVVDRQSLPTSSIPILPLHLRPALLAGIAIVDRSGPEMLQMLQSQMMGENKARFSSAIEEIMSSSCRSTASSQLQLI